MTTFVMAGLMIMTDPTVLLFATLRVAPRLEAVTTKSICPTNERLIGENLARSRPSYISSKLRSYFYDARYAVLSVGSLETPYLI